MVCFIIYFLLGFFGAARWGLDTNTNLLVNDWGPPAYQGALNILLGVYLALTNPPLVYPVAHILRVRCAPSFAAHLRGHLHNEAGCCHELRQRLSFAVLGRNPHALSLLDHVSSAFRVGCQARAMDSSDASSSSP